MPQGCEQVFLPWPNEKSERCYYVAHSLSANYRAAPLGSAAVRPYENLDNEKLPNLRKKVVNVVMPGLYTLIFQ